MRNQAGSFGLLLLLGVGAMLLIGGAYFIFRTTFTTEVKVADPRLTFEELKARVTHVMNAPAIVNASVDRNPNAFSCLFQSDGKCLNQGGLFLLYEDAKARSAALSQLMRGTGLTAEGLGCSNFPSAACPLRVEARWKPVCGGAHCENTRSFHLEASVVLQADAAAQPERWGQIKMYNPELKLSQAVTCERGGGVWAETRCMTPGEAATYRQVASGSAPVQGYASEGEGPVGVPEEELICPDHINIQGSLYTLERMSPDPAAAGGRATGLRGQVRVAAMNGCPAYDTFTFQCQMKNPAQFAGEGQWIQVEAQMAPGCDAEEMVEGESHGYSRQ